MTFDGKFKCAHPAVMADTLCAWPPGCEVTWYLDPTRVPPTLPGDEAGAAIARGLAHWPAACGVSVRRVTDPTQARLVIGFTEIDGPYGILGETELPCEGRSDVTHLMRLDVAEPWTAFSLEMVVAHESGHGLGLVHAPADTLAVMDPYYNPALTTLQPWDVAQAQVRYGPPATTPAQAPPSTPTAAPASSVVVEFTVDSPGTYQITLSVAAKS